MVPQLSGLIVCRDATCHAHYALQPAALAQAQLRVWLALQS